MGIIVKENADKFPWSDDVRPFIPFEWQTVEFWQSKKPSSFTFDVDTRLFGNKGLYASTYEYSDGIKARYMGDPTTEGMIDYPVILEIVKVSGHTTTLRATLFTSTDFIKMTDIRKFVNFKSKVHWRHVVVTDADGNVTYKDELYHLDGEAVEGYALQTGTAADKMLLYRVFGSNQTEAKNTFQDMFYVMDWDFTHTSQLKREPQPTYPQNVLLNKGYDDEGNELTYDKSFDVSVDNWIPDFDGSWFDVYCAYFNAQGYYVRLQWTNTLPFHLLGSVVGENYTDGASDSWDYSQNNGVINDYEITLGERLGGSKIMVKANGVDAPLLVAQRPSQIAEDETTFFECKVDCSGTPPYNEDGAPASGLRMQPAVYPELSPRIISRLAFYADSRKATFKAKSLCSPLIFESGSTPWQKNLFCLNNYYVSIKSARWDEKNHEWTGEMIARVRHTARLLSPFADALGESRLTWYSDGKNYPSGDGSMQLVIGYPTSDRDKGDLAYSDADFDFTWAAFAPFVRGVCQVTALFDRSNWQTTRAVLDGFEVYEVTNETAFYSCFGTSENPDIVNMESAGVKVQLLDERLSIENLHADIDITDAGVEAVIVAYPHDDETYTSPFPPTVKLEDGTVIQHTYRVIQDHSGSDVPVNYVFFVRGRSGKLTIGSDSGIPRYYEAKIYLAYAITGAGYL